MAEPQDMIVPLLREMREEIKRVREEMHLGFSNVGKRLEKIDSAQKIIQIRYDRRHIAVETDHR